MWVYLHTFVGHNMTQEGHLSKPELTLAEFCIQLMLSKYLQGYSQILFMIFLGLRVDENVINEYYDNEVKVFTEASVHEIHKQLVH